MITSYELSIGASREVPDHKRPLCPLSTAFFIPYFFHGLINRCLEASAVIGRNRVEVLKVLSDRHHFTRGQGPTIGTVEGIIIELILVHKTSFEFALCF